MRREPSSPFKSLEADDTVVEVVGTRFHVKMSQAMYYAILAKANAAEEMDKETSVRAACFGAIEEYLEARGTEMVLCGKVAGSQL